MSQQVLHRRGEPVGEVYFPGGGACSLLTGDGRKSAEIAVIGNEGVVGANVFFGEVNAGGDAVVTLADSACYVMNAASFNHVMAQRRAFHNLVVRYSQTVVGQAMQLRLCNTLHSDDARICRWLLTARDRLVQNVFPVRYGVVADRVGISVPTAARILARLADTSAIDYRGGYVRIADREALLERSCECYSALTTMFGRLLPDLDGTRSSNATGFPSGIA